MRSGFFLRAGSEQDPQRAFAAVAGGRVAEGQDILAADQPALDQLAQNAQTAGRAIAAPMHDAQAAFSGALRFGEEAGHFGMCFVPVEAVQVGMILDRPASTAQVTQDAARESGTQEGISVADGQQVVDFERAVQGFADGGGLVELALAWARAGFRRFEGDAVLRAQRPAAFHRCMESRQFFGGRLRSLAHGKFGCHGERRPAPANRPGADYWPVSSRRSR